MKLRNVFIGVIISIIIGAGFFFFGASRQIKKTERDTSTTEHADYDSVTHVNPEALSTMGAKPEKNLKDGSVKIVEEFIKSNTKNPNTFEFLEWSEVFAEAGYWKVRCKYKGISSFNAEVTTNAWFYIRNQKVVRTKIISKI